jgi:ubiquinone biosynthesis monooxygenase Coq7
MNDAVDTAGTLALPGDVSPPLTDDASPPLTDNMSPPLPGDMSPRSAIERMIRVDHAGEYGAKRIYQGQLAVLGRSDKAELLRHMQAQEQVHLDTFAALVAQRRVRPTALLPFWHVAGFVLGAATAALGERAAMACTVAVEETIDEHYAAQSAALGDDETELQQTIETFRAEELEHRDIGLANGAEQAPAYRLLTQIIKVGCRVAIRVSERI